MSNELAIALDATWQIAGNFWPLLIVVAIAVIGERVSS